MGSWMLGWWTSDNMSKLLKSIWKMAGKERKCADTGRTVFMNRRQRGVESLQGRVTAARSWPLFRERKNHLRRCWKKLAGHNFDFRAKSSWEKIFNIYKNFLSGGFRSKVKIVTAGLFATPTYFCWQLAFHRHLPTSGRQNRVKNLLYPPFIYIFWILSA